MLLICYESWATFDKYSHLKCHFCPEYFIVYSFVKNKVITEKLLVKNFGFQFYPSSKEVRVYKEASKGRIFMQTFTLNKLTHELAVQWVNKLKIYVTFQ